jgi:putative restriction endonuclease
LSDSFRTLIQLIDGIRPWSQNGQRAPHKPLLLLLALGRHLNGEPEWVPFTEIESGLRELLTLFGPTRATYHPEYPFWRLANKDKLWELRNHSNVRTRMSNSDPPITELRRHQVCGRLPQWVQQAIDTAPENGLTAARHILEGHFPESLHRDIAASVDIDLGDNERRGRSRSRKFRDSVLRAYGHRCAVCGYDVRLEKGPVIGLEAAHIRMHKFNGPNSESNGLALCAMHHKLFDYGAFTLTEDLRLMASATIAGSNALDRSLLEFHGKLIHVPRDPALRPDPRHVRWHSREIFKRPPSSIPRGDSDGHHDLQ